MSSSTCTPECLSGKHEGSFAYCTLKDRLPIIICKVIDSLYRNRNSLRSELGDLGIKEIQEGLSKLRYELQTNKPLSLLGDHRPDVDVWNEYLEACQQQEDEPPRWFSTSWLYSECYLYRRMVQATGKTDFDLFQLQKRQAFESSLLAITALAGQDLLSTPDRVKDSFLSLLSVCLWGNQCDLSISAGQERAMCGHALWDSVSQSHQNNLLVNHSEQVWSSLNTASTGATVDLVMDNAGFECFADLCLADFLIVAGLAGCVRLRVKCMPWFVSDTTRADIHWMLERMAQQESDRLLRLSHKWTQYLSDGRWTLHADPFWTYPHDYSKMAASDPDLYKELSSSKLIIFKGDLNYRKLVGDLKWDPTVPFEDALRLFRPAPLVAVRTLKANVVTGLAGGQAESISKLDSEWMVNGEWGLIQFARSLE